MSSSLQTATAAPLKRYFVGYSTQNSQLTGVRSLYDVDLINVDLMTAFMTRVGERVMRPDYGCKLWDYLMEPLTTALRDDIVAEVLRICNLDSRLVLQNSQVYQLDQGFTIQIVLLYLPWNVIGTFTANFVSADAAYFGAGL